ncbi:DUF4398 domain-containing protein [Chondromyces crocatus]|uniref:Uncharacterized protein n=1 Tax=Chondromyces crocatus TaxID=52 RepID=A0A0K1EAU4_CHOCO|nr:DUF4398 domain-containing protein [Chondromyces crocatus]AKT38006.1 uncharacterized protein CMC5_021470 [Chondromyces crocatus]
MRWTLLLCAVAPVVVGCAGRLEAVGSDGTSVERARALMEQAWTEPMAMEASAALEEANRALEHAERETRTRPGSRAAADAIYLAERMAERARLEARCAAAREALDAARLRYAQATRSLEEARSRLPRGNDMALPKVRANTPWPMNAHEREMYTDVSEEP